MSAPTHTTIPGYVAGTWDIDPVHSDVSFTVRHMMVSKVRGRFTQVSGEIVTGGDITSSVVTATVDASSIDTGSGFRPERIRMNEIMPGALCSSITAGSSSVTTCTPIRAFGVWRKRDGRNASR